jgi:hypothetical protein
MNKFKISETEFDALANEAFKTMRDQYPGMTMGDLQSVATYITVLKMKILKANKDQTN